MAEKASEQPKTVVVIRDGNANTTVAEGVTPDQAAAAAEAALIVLRKKAKKA